MMNLYKHKKDMQLITKVHPWQGLKVWVSMIVLTFAISAQALATDYYVSSSGDNSNGSSWAKAFTDLESALSTAAFGDVIYVAADTYTPTAQYSVTTGAASGGNNRNRTFKISDGVAVYGGLVGNETPITQAVLDARDFATNTTVLSGDFNGNDSFSGSYPDFTFTNYNENANHVVLTYEATSATILDGFTIRGGNGLKGSGLYNNGRATDNPIIRNIVFTENQANEGAAVLNSTAGGHFSDCLFTSNTANTTRAGAVSNDGGSSASFTDCTFTYNLSKSAVGGGAVYNTGDASFTNCTFSSNKATAGSGGAIINFRCSPVYNSCTFSDNESNKDGGAMQNYGVSNSNSSPSITNCVFNGKLCQEWWRSIQ